MANSNVRQSRRWRRVFRLSLRGLIVVVLLIGAWLGWLVRSAELQRAAVAAITSPPTRVMYDWQWKNGRYIKDGKPWWPTSIVHALGVDYFGHVTWIQASSLTDSQLVQVGRLARLERLRVDSPRISDSGLVALRGLNRLDSLDLRGGGAITDAGMVHLRKLKSLEFLNLYNARITDAGIVHLKRLTKLKSLYVGATDVTGAGLADLASSLPGLQIGR